MTDKLGGPAVPSATALTALRPLAHDQVRLGVTGWLGAWQHRNLDATIPHVLDRLEQGEAYSNLARLAGDSGEPWSGMVFTDSDVYKALEAVAWAGPDLDPDSGTLARASRLVDLLTRVQESDGYLNSHVQGVSSVERWSDPQWGHELYCAGHLVQAAVAASRTGALPGLLEVALRFADLLVRQFGAGNPAYIEGHPELETALVELYRVTGTEAYLALAARQIEDRGHGRLGPGRFGSPYFQDHEPVRSGAPATGHAVRQLYLLAGAVDVAVETHDLALLSAVRATWADLFASKTYVTGAHGSRHRDEAIGDPYELPADRAYAETCAAIASVQLNWRLLLATGDAVHAEEMETALYNAVAVSTAIDGRAFFYSNPLQLRTGHDGGDEDAPSQRLPWYRCACCPPNLARLLASVHDYLATTTDGGIQLHHPADARITTPYGEGTVTLTVSTAYPYDGRVEVGVESTASRPWELALRVPRWCAEARLTVDDEPIPVAIEDGYARVGRDWDGGSHLVVLTLAMPVRLVEAHPRVDAVRGCVAVARGPLVYAVEAADLPDGVVLEDIRLRSVRAGRTTDDPATIAPFVVDLEVDHVTSDVDPLYRRPAAPLDARTLVVTAVPYHRWGNRGPGAMRVWLPTTTPPAVQRPDAR